MKVKNEDFLKTVSKAYDHPAIILFRSFELRALADLISLHDFDGPVLDIGCGEGNIAKSLFLDKLDYGIDLSQSELDKAKLLGAYDNLICADATNLPFKNESMGAVFSNSVIEHIPDNERVLSEAGRVLKKGGFFIFSSPTKSFSDLLFFTKLLELMGLRKLAVSYKNKRNKMLNHYHLYDHLIYNEKLKPYGMEVIDYRYYLDNRSMMLWDFYAALGFFFRSIPLVNEMRLPLWLKYLFVKSISKLYYGRAFCSDFKDAYQK